MVHNEKKRIDEGTVLRVECSPLVLVVSGHNSPGQFTQRHYTQSGNYVQRGHYDQRRHYAQ